MFSSIPTTYNGIRFRSRLEAKWAYIFDRLDWEWDYEPFDLNGWIPDFVISNYRSLKEQIPYDPIKPLVVDVKPIVYISDINSSPPDDIRNKIEKSLDSPAFHKPYSCADWDKWFANLEYYPAILGTHPSHAWIMVPSWCWRQVGRHSYWAGNWEPELKATLGFWSQNWKPIWHDATNALQWRAPA